MRLSPQNEFSQVNQRLSEVTERNRKVFDPEPFAEIGGHR